MARNTTARKAAAQPRKAANPAQPRKAASGARKAASTPRKAAAPAAKQAQPLGEVGKPLAGAAGYIVVLNRGYYAVGKSEEGAYAVRMRDGKVLRKDPQGNGLSSLKAAKDEGKAYGAEHGLTTRPTKASHDRGLLLMPEHHRAHPSQKATAPAKKATAKATGTRKAQPTKRASTTSKAQPRK